MYDNDYVSFSGTYTLNEDLDYDPKELLMDVAADYVGGNLSVPPTSVYKYGNDVLGSVAGNYNHYYDNMNTSPSFSTGKHNLKYITNKYHLPGDPRFNTPNNDYRFQSYNATKNKVPKYTYDGEIPNRIIYDLGNRYAVDEITSYHFPKHDYSDHSYYPTITKQNAKYYNHDRDITGSYQNRVLNNGVKYDMYGYPEKINNNSYKNQMNNINKEGFNNMNKNKGALSEDFEDNTTRKKMMRNNRSSNARTMNIIDSGTNNYNKILQINKVDEAKITDWEGKYFEESRDMDEYNKDATFREYGYTQDNDNTEFDFGNRDIDYSDFREYHEYNSTHDMAGKSKSNLRELSNKTGKAKFKGRNPAGLEHVDDREHANGLVNVATNGFGKPFKSKYKMERLTDKESSNKLLGSVLNRTTILDTKLDKLKKQIPKMDKIKGMKEKYTELYKNLSNILTAIRQHLNKLRERIQSRETDSQLAALDVAMNKLFDVFAVIKSDATKAYKLLHDTLDILKAEDIANEVELINEFISTTTELEKEATELVTLLKILIFLILVIIVAVTIRYIYKSVRPTPNKQYMETGSNDTANPVWLHTNE